VGGNLIERILEISKQHVLVCILGSLVIGGGISYLLLQNRIHSDYLIRSSSEISDSSEPEKSIFVDISGAVVNPGVYEINHGSRVSDAISLSGGILNEASSLWVSKNINLSRVLEDSSKIYIPFEWEFYIPEEYEISKTVNGLYSSSSDVTGGEDSPSDSSDGGADVSDGGDSDTSGSGAVGDDGKVNVNKATSSELDSLSGIGPAYAEKIISSRPYKDLDDFTSRSGLYKSTVENIKALITF
jgi:competence protein ComEA